MTVIDDGELSGKNLQVICLIYLCKILTVWPVYRFIENHFLAQESSQSSFKLKRGILSPLTN